MRPAFDDSGPQFYVSLVHFTGFSHIDLQIFPDQGKQSCREMYLQKAKVNISQHCRAEQRKDKGPTHLYLENEDFFFGCVTNVT